MPPTTADSAMPERVPEDFATPQNPGLPSGGGPRGPATPPGRGPHTTAKDIRRWRRYLADERAEAASYRDLASRRHGEERDILLALAEAERRHEHHWLDLLGDDIGRPLPGRFGTRMIGWLARHLGGVFVLALAQRTEARSQYANEADATPTMVADELIHLEVVRALATRGRNRLSGTLRAAVFGANDGLVSNLALILGIGASGASQKTILLSGLAGLLAGALSMGAGEYVSIRSQRELLDASTPSEAATAAVGDLDVNANELALVYRARGMAHADAEQQAKDVIARRDLAADQTRTAPENDHETHGTAMGAALSSFVFFASGAVLPVLPYLFGLDGGVAIIVATAIVGIALVITGGVVGLLSGTSPATRGLRQLAIGLGAAGVTWVVGSVFGATVG